jgi:hypothetical protein
MAAARLNFMWEVCVGGEKRMIFCRIAEIIEKRKMGHVTKRCAQKCVLPWTSYLDHEGSKEEEQGHSETMI